MPFADVADKRLAFCFPGNHGAFFKVQHFLIDASKYMTGSLRDLSMKRDSILKQFNVFSERIDIIYDGHIV